MMPLRYKDMYAGAPAGVKSKVKQCLGAVTCLSSAEEEYDCFPLEVECLDGEAEEEGREGEGVMSRIARLECQIELILCREEHLANGLSSHEQMKRDGWGSYERGFRRLSTVTCWV